MSAEPSELRLSASGERSAPAPCPGGWRLIAERAYVIEGPAAPLSAAEAALPASCVERIGRSALRLGFGNAVGAFDVPGLGRLHVQSGKWAEEHFDAMLAEIVDALAALPFAAGSGGGTGYEREGTGEDVLYHAFLYLHNATRCVAPESRPLVHALHTIVRDPHRRMAATERRRPLPLAAHVDPASLLREVARGCTRARGAAARSPLSRVLNGHLPLDVDERSAHPTLDTVENRFALAFLLRAESLVHRVRSRASSASSATFARGLQRRCDEIETTLAPIRRWGGWSEIGSLSRFPAESMVLQRRRGYRDLLHHALRLQASTRLPLEPRTARDLLELKDIATLYEIWCFFVVERSITQILGARPIAAHRPRHGDFEVHLPYDFRVIWRGGVELDYNLRFSRSRTGDRRSTSLPLRPDVVLRLLHQQPAMHVLDAKFRLQRARSAQGEEEATDADLARFRPGDVHKMHTYRDALPAVRSAWALYPGDRYAFFASNGVKATGPTELPRAVDGVGAVPLTPGGDRDALLATFSRLLER